jgi:hypothetical protein
LCKKSSIYLVDLTAVDWPKRDKRFEVVLILYSFPKNEHLRLKVQLAENEPFRTVVGVWPTANWLEREVYDMFGIRFRGTPEDEAAAAAGRMAGLPAAQGLRHLEAGRSLDARKPGNRERAIAMANPHTHLSRRSGNSSRRGRNHPQHGSAASLHARRAAREAAPGRRKGIGSECVIGYLHRGVEKIAEHRSYQQFAPYVDRMDYVAAVSNGLGYCEAVEKLMGVEAPPRARVIRTILTEMQRIASHLFWLGTHALDIGALTPLFYCLREREEILKIFEKYCGARLTTHAFRIGGLQYEAYDEMEKDVSASAKSSTSAWTITRPC